jgi:ribose 5-phosphate isomerase B
VKVLIASEHAGYELKQLLADYLRSQEYEVAIAGALSSEPIDYPPIAAAAACDIVAGEHELGILICGTGIGVSIAASKVPGAIVGLCTNEYMAKMARAHNNANILCLGSRVIGVNLAFEIADAFLATPFEGGRHERRYEKIRQIEEQYLRERATE